MTSVWNETPRSTSTLLSEWPRAPHWESVAASTSRANRALGGTRNWRDDLYVIRVGAGAGVPWPFFVLWTIGSFTFDVVPAGRGQAAYTHM